MRNFGNTGPQPKSPTEAIQGFTTTLGSYYKYTPEQAAWIRKNVKNLLFSRSSDNAFRESFVNASRGRKNKQEVGLYINFVSITQSERDKNNWEDYIAKKNDGTPITIGTGEGGIGLNQTEYLATFWNTDWLDVRLGTVPDYEGKYRLAKTNLTYIFLDLCNLYPIPLLAGDPPISQPSIWKQNMLNAINYYRNKITPRLRILPNCVRQHVGVAGYVQDPATFYQFDGGEAIGKGFGNAGLMEVTMKWDAESPEVQKLYASLRTLRRLNKEGKPTYSTWKYTESDKQWRINGLAAFGLVYTPGLTQYKTATGTFAANPPDAYPENNVDFGAPVSNSAGNIHPVFEQERGTVNEVITREFANGTAVIFNSTFSEQPVPAPYNSWRVVSPNEDITIPDSGEYDGALITTAMPVNPTIPTWSGMIVKKPA
mgnify:FL=1